MTAEKHIKSLQGQIDIIAVSARRILEIADNLEIQLREANERAEKAEAVAKQLMFFEYVMDGNEENDETEYWKAVSMARELVGDFDPATLEDTHD